MTLIGLIVVVCLFGLVFRLLLWPVTPGQPVNVFYLILGLLVLILLLHGSGIIRGPMVIRL